MTANIYDQKQPLGKLVGNTFSSCSILPVFTLYTQINILLNFRNPILLEKMPLLQVG